MPDQPDQWELPVSFGVHGKTGQLLPGIDEASFVNFYRKEEDPNAKAALDQKKEQSEGHLGTSAAEVEDPNDLSQVGWGVIYSKSVTENIKAALKPLIDKRQAEAGDLYRCFEGPDSFLESDVDAHGWLKRPKKGQEKPVSLVDPVNPSKGVPYYILIVAPPDEISFDFQYELDLQFAVGRLWFPTEAEFSQYVHSLLRYENEKEPVTTARQAAIFAPKHDFDRPTQQFSRFVAEPFAADRTLFSKGPRKFGLQTFLGADATRANLESIFTGDIPNGPPALLFTGSHGMGFDSGVPEQAPAQGALLCQDWPGFGDISEEYYYAGHHLPSNAKLHGMIHFFFACYSAGWPQLDNFAAMGDQPMEVAPKPGLARLPQAMLSHPNGGALAVIGHVDRAWPHSFRSVDQVVQIESFRDVTAGILSGKTRLGEAMDKFNAKWSMLASQLTALRTRWAGRDTDASGFETQTAKKLASLWVAHDDARNYIIFGDPAVRLRRDAMPPLEGI